MGKYLYIWLASGLVSFLVTFGTPTIAFAADPVISQQDDSLTLSVQKATGNQLDTLHQKALHMFDTRTASLSGLTTLIQQDTYPLPSGSVPPFQKDLLREIAGVHENLTKIQPRIDIAYTNRDTQGLINVIQAMYDFRVHAIYYPRVLILNYVYKQSIITSQLYARYNQLQALMIKASKEGKDVNKANIPALLSTMLTLTSQADHQIKDVVNTIKPMTPPISDNKAPTNRAELVTALANADSAKNLLLNAQDYALQIAKLLETLPQPTPTATPTKIPTPTPTTKPSPSPTPSATPTPTSIPDQSITLNQGTSLGIRPAFTGAMGWKPDAVKGREIFFQKTKALGINKIRLMDVLQGKSPEQLQKLDYAITTITQQSQQEIILCLGDLASPPIPNSAIDESTATFSAVLTHLVQTYGVTNVNTMAFELDNEYGAANSDYLFAQYYQVIKDVQDKNPDLHIRIIAPASQRGDYHSFDRELRYFANNNIPLYAISAHYYLKGSRVDVPAELAFSSWLSTIKSIIAKYNYSNLPFFIDEYGYNGNRHDSTHKTSYYAAWLASRLGDSSYYNNPTISYFFTAAYSQPYDSETGGYGGLYSGYGQSQAPYPTAREIELENRFGSSTLYKVTGIPADIEATGVSGVTDGNGQWLLWNLSGTKVTVKVPSATSKQVGYIDERNGNSKYVIEQMPQPVNWTTKRIQEMYQKSDPFNDPTSGTKRIGSDAVQGKIQITIPAQGVTFVGN